MLDQPEEPSGLAALAGRQVRKWRKQRGMTLQQLATATGTSPQTICRLETAAMTMSVEWLERIAKALCIQPHILLRDDADATAIEKVEERARRAEMGLRMLRGAVESVCRDHLE